MMEQKIKMVAIVRKITILLALILILISLVFQDKFISAGIAIGALGGLIGFNMIVKMAYKIEGPRSGRAASANYLLRYLMYGCIFGLSYSQGVNIFAILIGFISSKVAILIYTRFFA